MKIPPIQRQQAINAYSQNRVQSATSTPGVGMKPDSIEISPEGTAFSETFREVMKTMQELPEREKTRHETAAQNVRAGTYDVPSDRIVGAMLRGLRIDREV